MSNHKLTIKNVKHIEEYVNRGITLLSTNVFNASWTIPYSQHNTLSSSYAFAQQGNSSYFHLSPYNNTMIYCDVSGTYDMTFNIIDYQKYSKADSSFEVDLFIKGFLRETQKSTKPNITFSNIALNSGDYFTFGEIGDALSGNFTISLS